MPGSDQAAVSRSSPCAPGGGDRAYWPKVLVWRPRDHTREYDWPGTEAVEQVGPQLRMPIVHVGYHAASPRRCSSVGRAAVL